MTLLRVGSVACLVVAVALLAAAFVRSMSGDDGAPYQPAPVTPQRATPTATASTTPAITPGIEASVTAAPTPTPAPYLGAVARIQMPSTKIDAAVEPIGLTQDNALDTPHNPRNVGWYDIYDRPGARNTANTGWSDFGVYPVGAEYRGNAVFAAHINYFPDVPDGPFLHLQDAALGDTITIVMENGLAYDYTVIHVEAYPANSIDMGAIIWPRDKPPGDEWITLISCGGKFIPLRPDGLGEYEDRVVVVATRVK